MARSKAIGIKELIDSVNCELLQRTDVDAFFCLEKVEMEITFIVARNMAGELEFQIANHDTDDSRADIQTIRVTLGAIRDFPGLSGSLLQSNDSIILK